MAEEGKRPKKRKRTKPQQAAADAKLLTKLQLALRYGVVPRTIDYWMQKGLISYLKIGRKLVRFDPEQCDQDLEKFRVAAT